MPGGVYVGEGKEIVEQAPKSKSLELANIEELLVSSTGKG